MGVVYGVMDSTGTVRYVGMTILTADRRFDKHRRDAARGSHLPFLRWLAKHPEATVTVLEKTDDLAAAEMRWIDHYGLENLLNISPGGNGGCALGTIQGAADSAKWTPELRKRVSLKLKEHYGTADRPPKLRMTPEERSAAVRAGIARLTPEQRSERARRAMETRQRKSSG